jgi:xylan 1,4-beta-xylosidase
MIQSPQSSIAQVTVNAHERSPLRRIWRYVGYDEPNYTYTPNGKELLAKLGRMSDAPYFIRCHFILCSGDGTGKLKWGSTNAYTEDENGEAVYAWEIIDRILDTYLETGCTPFIELGFMPEALSTAPADTPYDDPRHGSWRFPPKDYGRWMELIQALGRHCLERYGLAEVRKWYWELWNEPDIFYWAGTIAEYNRLYDYTVAGLTSAIPQALIGGPGTTSSMDRPESTDFLHAFLDHCANGTNAVTGERGTRLDYISFHAKGGGYRANAAATKQTPTIYTVVGNVAASLRVAEEFPQLKGREVILTECDPDGWAAGTIHDNVNLFYRNTEYYASYVASTVNHLIDLKVGDHFSVDGILTWAFQFEGRPYFEGFRTLSTNGLDKAVLNVFRLLAKLGGTRLQLSSDSARDPLTQGSGDQATMPADIAGIAAIDESEAVQVFLSCHHDDWDVKGTTAVTVQVAGLPTGESYTVYQSLVAEGHSNSYTAWDQMGQPQSPTADQLAALKRAARLETEEVGQIMVADHSGGYGSVTVEIDLPNHSVCLIQFVPNG